MSDALSVLQDEVRETLPRERPPKQTSPMLATLVKEPFSDPEWIYERKLDGIRCLARRHGKRVELRSRSGQDLNDTYPELVEALERGPREDYLADGEIVAFEGNRTSFARLQQRSGLRDPDEARRSGVAVYLYVFDLLHWAGRRLTGLPLTDRKRVLKRGFRFDRRVRYTPHRREAGEDLLREACEKGWEGLIAKRADSKYEHRRTRAWRKLKCVNRQELVIGGYTEPQGSRKGFGALLVGYYEDGELRYAGKVGTGYDDALLERLSQRLERMERDDAPFENAPRERGAHWVSPRLVAEFGFTEWTRDGKLRHPRFVGLRTDKSPKQVRRERPA